VDLKRVYITVALDSAENAIVRQVLAVWQSKRTGRPFPCLSDLSLRELAPALTHVTLCDVIDGGVDFRLRLAGEEVLDAYGHHLKGKLLSSLVEEIGTTMLAAYRMAAQSGTPVLLRGWFEHERKQLFEREVLIVPLGQEKVDHVLAVGVLLAGIVNGAAQSFSKHLAA
jgi:hypothetical protein